MKYHFFTIAAKTPEAGQETLNMFCGQQRVVSVEKYFVAQGLDSFWSICVTTIDGSEKSVSGGKRDRIDYKEILSEQDFAVYAELRNLRKALAEQEGVPAYALFDPIIILSVGLVLDGKKQLPFGMLVGRLPNACRSGDLKECAYVTV
jgi:hypothetical protein